MPVKIDIPEKAQNTSMGRRLFSMAAPIVGGIFGGPAGAAAGSVIGSKMSGASTKDALLSGAMTGAMQGISGGGEKAAAPAGELNLSEGFKAPELGESAFGRRMNVLSQDPKVGLQEGLNVLGGLPQGHPLREKFTAPLVKASYLAGRK